MKFLFWQNIISIHQSAFLKSLSQAHNVCLIVEKENHIHRISQGWVTPDMGLTEIFISPSPHDVEKMLNSEAIHIFSGIDAFPFVFNAFKLAANKRLTIGVMLEPFEWTGIKGVFRKIKYRFLYLKYGRQINFILAIGSKAISQYKSAGFNSSILFDWGYFTENPILKPNTTLSDSRIVKPSVLFIGRLDINKNILSLIDLCCKHHSSFDHLGIVGDGPLRTQINEIAQNNSFIHVLGNLPNTDVRLLIATYDLLVLPSKYDGWGAVVNEALQVGTKVIASENCGSSDLLDGKFRGEKFNSRGQNNFENVLKHWLEKGKVSMAERKRIQEWSHNNISGKVAAEYFTEVIHFISGESINRPCAPWFKNESV